eukprot:gb/GEZN01010676.1/.p1 GENE.gb/GEZN01010676.1/~~gb/GEZN01010676.1/.p1  ORF type:complete len:140 (-),score=14.38 gb/GEZN01010676.1/:760-1179(-)
MFFPVQLDSILMVHSALFFWACLSAFMGSSYVFSNFLTLMVGIYACIDRIGKSPSSFLVFFWLFTILNDLICLVVFADYSKEGGPPSKFSMLCAIVALILKPFSFLYIYKDYLSRMGSSGDNYSNIDSGDGHAGLPSDL